MANNNKSVKIIKKKKFTKKIYLYKLFADFFIVKHDNVSCQIIRYTETTNKRKLIVRVELYKRSGT